MKLNKQLVALAMAGGIATPAFAELDLASFTSSLYGESEFRVYSQRWGSRDSKAFGPSHRAQARFGLGMKTDKFDGKIVFGGEKWVNEGSSPVVQERATRFEASYDLFSNDYFAITPYTEVMMPYTDYNSREYNGTKDQTSGAQEYKHILSRSAVAAVASTDLSTPVGVLTPSVGVEGAIWLTTDHERKAKVKRSNGAALTADGSDVEAPATYSDYETEVSAGLAFAPNAVDGLTLTGKYYFTTEYAANPTLVDDANPEGDTKSVWSTANHNTLRGILSYAINDTFEVSYEGWVKVGDNAVDTIGGEDRRRYKHVAAVKANLF